MQYLKKKIFRKLAKLLIIICLFFIALTVAVIGYIQYNKTRILNEIIQTAATRIRGKIVVGDMNISLFENFPRISILLKDVKVNDSIHHNIEESIFNADKVYIGLKWGSILSGNIKANNIVITGGKILLLTDSTGYTNQYLLNISGGNGKKSRLPHISIQHSTFSIKDLLKRKDHEYMINNLEFNQKSDSDLTLSGYMDVTVHRMIINPLVGSYLTDKRIIGAIEVRIEKKVLSFDKLALTIADRPFRISGSFGLDKIAPKFRLEVYSPSVEYGIAKSMMPEKLATSLSLADIDKPLEINAVIEGNLKSGIPAVKIGWKVTDAHFVTPLQNFDHAIFRGTFTNEIVPGLVRDDPNSGIVLEDFSAEWRGMPVHSKKISLLNLTNPLLTCDFTCSVPLATLNQVAGISSFNFLQGSVNMSMNYKGPLILSQKQSEINGLISISGGQILYAPRNVMMNNVHGDIIINNSDVTLKGFSLVVSGQSFEMNASSRNLITLLEKDPSTAVVNFKLNTPSVDIGSLLFLLKNKTKIAVHTGSKFNNTFSKIDDIMEKGQLNVLLNAGRLNYKRFNAVNFIADVRVLSNQYIINKIQIGHAGGLINLNGDMINTGRLYAANVNFSMKDVDVEKLFYAFDNFGQDGITSSNIRGLLSLNANANIQLDYSGKVEPGSANSTIDFVMKNGKLVNFEPVKKIQKSIFKNRNFSDISFAELKNTLLIRQRQVVFNKMAIRSSVITLFVEGIYSQAGNSDISIQIPLSNLNKKKYNLLNPADEKKGGNIFLRGRPGKDGKIEFKLDLFNKYQRAHN